ncbi:uncharacterized protein LOC129583694 [Paramacrobiotus metropolitanus]|uniref:uncharacterized protein LOC129583694 n=1 Tax=Paramacrobiotus metropolitanus TaxID=2943436 RepID=UPI002445DE87|nr:uncharacterized protein LOC129583694 [Paramacrobiotus metropolitanus]
MEPMDIDANIETSRNQQGSGSLQQTVDGQSIGQPQAVKLQDIELITITGKQCGIPQSIPSPVVFVDAVSKAGWSLRSDHNQSVSEVYRVVKDLHTQQKFTELTLIYISKLQLIVVCGKEPVEESAEMQPGESTAEFVVMTRFISEEEQQKMFIYVVPGSFALGTITGTMRFILDDELQTVSKVLNEHYQIQPKPGWTLAVTDCDQVCYYVERMLTLDQLKPQPNRDRDEELCEFFGINRAINARRQDRLRVQQEKREQRKQQETQQNTDLVPGAADEDEDWENDALSQSDDSVGNFDEPDEYDILDQ